MTDVFPRSRKLKKAIIERLDGLRLTAPELSATLGTTTKELDAALETLAQERKVQVVETNVLDCTSSARGKEYELTSPTRSSAHEREVIRYLLLKVDFDPHAVQTRLPPSMFAYPDNRACYRAVLACAAEGDTVCVDTVVARLVTEESIDEPNARVMLESVVGIDREVISLSLGDDEEVDALDPVKANQAVKMIVSLSLRRDVADLSILDDAAPLVASSLDETIERLLQRANGTDKPIPVPWPSLGAVLRGGLWPGMYVLVGATGSGKTQLALQVLLGAAVAGVPSLYIGLEMERDAIIARLAAMVTGASWSKLTIGGLGAETESVLAQAKEKLQGLPVRTEEAPPNGWTAEDLRARAQALSRLANGGRCLLILDFLQLVAAPEGERLDVRERIAALSYAARQVAREFGVTVLVVSSAARDKYEKLNFDMTKKEEGPWTTAPVHLVGVGKESGDMEFAADGVFVIVREVDKVGESMGPVHLAVAKLRTGIPAWVDLFWDEKGFSEARMPEPEPPGAPSTAAPAEKKKKFGKGDV